MWRLFFHPLSKFPGRKLAAISNLPYIKWSLTVEIHSKLQELHDRYGDVVRRPNALTYRSVQAWTDMYSHRKFGALYFGNVPHFYIPSSSGGAANLVNASNTDHSRQNRLLSHAFSERWLRDQEKLILGYIDLFIRRLGEYADRKDESKPLDLVRWLNFLTFDIIGDLALGEPFGYLGDSQYYPWVATMFQSIKTGAFLRAFSLCPILALLLRTVMSKETVLQFYMFS